ncbi:MAG: hypothetical protein R3C49_07930 [Planctomycetaceae bacterium]
MAGAFTKIPNGKTGREEPYWEYNVIKDLPAARNLMQAWPVDVVWSGFEIGLNLKYPYQSIAEDCGSSSVSVCTICTSKTAPRSPDMDLTSVLYAVRPGRTHFDVSPEGNVVVDEEGYTLVHGSGRRDTAI